AGLRHALAVHDIELDLLEGWRQLVLDYLDARLVAHDLVTLLERADTAYVEAHGSIELEGIAARGRLGRTEHDTNLHADLVDEDHHAVRTGNRRGELAQRLAHQPGLQAWQRVAHLTLDFRPRGERGDGIDDQDIDGTGAHQRIGDLQRLLARIRLRDQKVLEI